MSFETKSGSLLNLFRDTEVDQYKIPKYQRAYSWTEEQVRIFCEDLNEAYQSKVEDYFFGAVIMIKDSQSEKIRNVIDGQQRITTFTIFISQLRNLCEEIIGELEEDKNSKIKYKRHIKQIKEKISDLSQCLESDLKGDRTLFKLELSNTDKSFFEQYIRISKSKDIIDTLESVIDLIEHDLKIVTDDDELSEYISKYKGKKSFKSINLSENISYKDLYTELCKNIDKYDKIKLKEELILKYLQEITVRYNIDINNYMRDLSLENEDQENIILFRDFNQENIKVVSHKRIVEAGKIIENELIKPILNMENILDQLNSVINLIDTFMKNTHIVTIISTNEDTAYTMFQVLNDRGRSLGVVDLLRPYTLQMLEGSKYSIDASSDWDKLAEKEDCDKYLRMYIESYTKVSSSDKKIHNKYKLKFFKPGTELLEISKKIMHISETYEVYEKLKNGEWPYDSNKTNNWNKNRLKQIITRLGYTKSIPLLMAIYDEVDESSFVLAIDIIERIVFRYITICEKRSTNLMNVYSKTIEEIRRDKCFNIEVFSQKMNDLLKEQGCGIEDFKRKLDGKKLTYIKSNRKIIQYFLSTIESYYVENYRDYDILSNPNKTVLNDDNIWIEHIYSQKPKEDYKNEYMDECINKIGNLTILENRNNMKLDNKSFVEKKSGKDYGYDKEKIIITKKLTELDKWEKDEYINNKNMYIDIAIRIFTLDGE